jgi:AraC family transcriptional regulator
MRATTATRVSRGPSETFFGFPPSAIRAEPGIVIELQEPLTMSTEPQIAPEPRIVDGRALRIVGVSEAYTTETRSRIPAQWERTVEEYGAGMFGGETYGVCYDFDGAEFRYMVGIAAERSGDLDWPDHIDLPGARYAVFDHEGHISDIPDTWQAIFENWAPNSGMQIAEAPQFELYSTDFDPSGSGGVSVWIPVEGG